MFGYDDDELNKIIQNKLAAEHVFVQMSLDRSQAGGVHEREILARWKNNSFGNSIAIGTSSRHNAISHLKIVIVDGVYTVKGSTNWSLSGEQKQDNEITLSRSAVVAAETRAILDLNHDFMLKQMVGSKLDVAKLLAGHKNRGARPVAVRRPAGGHLSHGAGRARRIGHPLSRALRRYRPRLGREAAHGLAVIDADGRLLHLGPCARTRRSPPRWSPTSPGRASRGSTPRSW